MLSIGHVPTQIYVNKTYIPHYNLAIIDIYFVEYIFFYIFFMHYRQFGKLPGFKAKTLPLFVKTHEFAQKNYF